jgi:signal transduction histidine kinase
MKRATPEFRHAGRMLLACCLLCGLHACGSQARAGPATHDVDSVHFTRAEVLTAADVGFTPAPRTLDADMLANLASQEQWKPVALPHVARGEQLPAAGDSTPTVISWYRLHVEGGSFAAGTLYLYVPRWKAVGRIAAYADGQLVYQSDSNLVWNGNNHPLLVALNATAGGAPPKTVMIRVNRLRSEDGALSTLWIGTAEALDWRYQIRKFLQGQLPFMGSAAFLAIGFFALAIWSARRREWLYLLFFLMSVVAFIRNLNYYVGQERLPISDVWFGWLTLNSLFWLLLTAHFFLVRLHRIRQPWLTAGLVGLTAIGGVVTFPNSALLPAIATLAPLGCFVLIGAATLILIAALRNSWISKSSESRLMAGWGYFCVNCSVYDWLLQENRVNVEGIYLAPYYIIGAFFIFMYVMFRRYVGAINGVEQLNANLEARLQAREVELAKSNQRLRAIEHRQTLSLERQRLMQDMHDGLGSSLLTALRIVENGRSGDAELAEVLRSCIDDLKLTIDSMEPVEADLLLLLATLRYRMGSRLENSGIILHWDIQSVPALNWLDPTNALHILRILQETFTNIIKHTKATEIWVSTGARDGGVVVAVADNGQGFVLQQALKSGGKGLSNQLRRAHAIGASIHWDIDESGASMTLWLPETTA